MAVKDVKTKCWDHHGIITDIQLNGYSSIIMLKDGSNILQDWKFLSEAEMNLKPTNKDDSVGNLQPKVTMERGHKIHYI